MKDIEIIRNEYRPVLKSYLSGLIKVFQVFLLAFFVARLLNTYYPLTQIIIDSLGLMALIFEGIALYGIMGWEIQTWHGNLPQEIFNRKCAIILASIGLGIFMCSMLLVPAQENLSNYIKIFLTQIIYLCN